MRTTVLAAALILAAHAHAAPAPSAAPVPDQKPATQKHLDKLKGDWKVSKETIDERRRDGNDSLDGREYTFGEGKVAAGGAKGVGKMEFRDLYGNFGAPAAPLKFAFSIAPSAKPGEIDARAVRRSKEVLIKGIYKFEGDDLVLCITDKGERPTEFKNDDDKRHELFRLTRGRVTPKVRRK